MPIIGWKEVKFVATRYQGLFPDIFEKSYNGTKFLFRHTDAQRTQASFRAFVDGEYLKMVCLLNPNNKHCFLIKKGIFGPNAHESIQIPPLDENIDLMKVAFCFGNIYFIKPLFRICSRTRNANLMRMKLLEIDQNTENIWIHWL